MPLHPQVKAFLAMVEESGQPHLYEQSPAEARAQTAAMRQLIGAGPDVAHVEDFSLPTSAGEIPARRYAPNDPAATVLWVHGGGWVICDLESHDAMCRLLAVSSGCRVIAIDYRLAPEHPFPASLEDSWDALRWVADEYGDAPVIVAGDSAGGNMATVCAIRARDRGGPDLALQVLIYPATDHDTSRQSYLEHGSGEETFLTREDMEWFTGHYLPNLADRDNPETAPLLTEDLSGLPPAIVLTAGYDPLCDSGLAYVDRLREAGVPALHQHYEDMIHAFFSLVNVLERGNEAVEQVGGEIRAVVARSGAHA
jgi:acetyl esterase